MQNRRVHKMSFKFKSKKLNSAPLADHSTTKGNSTSHKQTMVTQIVEERVEVEEEKHSNLIGDSLPIELPSTPHEATKPALLAPSSRGYMVKLTLHSGHHLAIRDRSGTSDPYVKIRHKNYKARSSIVYRNLNPIWNEKFGFKVRDLTQPIRLKVYDKDSVTSDDFMGWGKIPLNNGSIIVGSTVSLNIELQDEKSKDEELGYLKVSVCVLPIPDSIDTGSATEDDQRQQTNVNTTTTTTTTGTIRRTASNRQNKKARKLWKSIVNIKLLEGRDLPAMDQNGFSDPYCKFRLGSQKYRSSVQHKTLNPEWKEQFNMKLYEEESTMLYINIMDRDYLSSDDFIGGCTIDLSEYEVQCQHDLTLPLEQGTGSIHLLLVISGISAQEEQVDGDSGHDQTMKFASNDYCLTKSMNFKQMEDVGLLKVTVIKADGLRITSNNCNPFCSVEVGQACLRTNTYYLESSPEWNKTFYFQIKDIHDSLHLVIFNDSKSKDEQLGQVLIPLLRIESGVTKHYQLKGKDCIQHTAGRITIRCELTYNYLRAAVRTINPKETPLIEADLQFQQKVLRNNVNRILAFSRPIMSLLRFIEYILSWKDKVLSCLSIVVYSLFCYFIELWMVFVIVVLAMVVIYVYIFVYKQQDVGDSHRHNRISRGFRLDEDSESECSDLDEYYAESEEEHKERHKGLRERFRQLKSLLLLVQIHTGLVADYCEKFKNLLSWSVPFLCWMIVAVCVVASVVTYFIPIRYIILLWGLNKLTKKLRKPNAISNQELLDFLSRAPTDLELAKSKELTVRSQLIKS